jgi:hypothetical protein
VRLIRKYIFLVKIYLNNFYTQIFILINDFKNKIPFQLFFLYKSLFIYSLKAQNLIKKEQKITQNKNSDQNSIRFKKGFL